MSEISLGIASDHGGFEVKEAIYSALAESYPDDNIRNLGVHNTDSVDYPSVAKELVDAIMNEDVQRGILVCGTGIGMSIAANRNPGIRAALIHDDHTAEMAKAHNNANILCMAGRNASIEDALRWIQIWLDTPYEGGRHDRRLEALDQLV